MAPFKFTKSIMEGKKIDVFNHGNHSRDFTYIDDIVEGVIRTTDRIAEPNLNWDSGNPDPASSSAPYRIYNIGNNAPVKLIDFIAVIEKYVGKKANIEMLPMQPSDVADTFADVTDLMKDVGYKPDTLVDDGVSKYVNWYRDFYQV